MTFKTEHAKKKEARDAAVYKEWQELTANPENSKTAVSEHLMKKYGVYSRATIWQMCRRAEARLKAQAENN